MEEPMDETCVASEDRVPSRSVSPPADPQQESHLRNASVVHPKRKPDKSKILRILSSDGEGSVSCSRCSEQFTDEDELERHVLECNVSSPSANERMETDDDISLPNCSSESNGDLKHAHEDAVNNNSNEAQAKMGQFEEQREASDGEKYASGRESPFQTPNLGSFLASSPMTMPSAELSLNEQLANSSLTLEAINNTRMTLAKLASAAAQRETGSESSIPDVSLLQRALYNLQHQQVIQMQLIKQLQDQLSIKNQSVEAEDLQDHIRAIPTPGVPEERPGAQSLINNFMDRLKHSNQITEETKPNPEAKAQSHSPSFSTGESITSTVIQHSDSPPSTTEPNTLEMLQRTANQVLSNASQGLLTNRLIDDYSKNGDCNDATNKHRCRYCGKVFGSDSALQIHLRSHTGERPFKCNICGNRFTTKGNLKVHFQRHQARFPHVKMNPHPIPEHLDKFYPPLLAQLGEISECPAAPTGPPSPFPSIGQPTSLPPCPSVLTPPLQSPLDLPIGIPNPLLPALQIPQEKPENLSWSKDVLNSPTANESVKAETPSLSKVSTDGEEPMDSSIRTNDPVKKEPDHRRMSEEYSQQLPYISNHQEEDMDRTRENGERDRLQDSENEDIKPAMKKENMDVDSQTASTPFAHQQTDFRPKQDARNNFPAFPFPGIRLPFPLNFPFLPGFNAPVFQNSLPPPQTRPVIPPGVDPAKDPNVYNSLLPRPGSTDSSWEALIEVKKTSETMKLEELVKNIEYKLEPNQCVICHRVLSCKSALQMHYRTHTGERPFKCKICNHTFTTKGNLKTHMSVHRARPHVGMLHQCPVCHKKFGNSLVLQQHIRLHTGEPTDLSPEQISAAEVRDMSPNFQSFPPNLLPPGVPLPPHHPLRGFAPFQFPMRYPISPDFLRTKDKIRMEDKGEEDEAYVRFKSEMMNLERNREQRVAEDLSTKIRDDNFNNGSSPRRSISPSPSDYSDPGMRETASENSSSYPSDRNTSGATSPAVSVGSQDSQVPLNLVSRPSHPPFWSPFGLFSQPLASNTQMTPTPSGISPVFSPLYLPNMPGRGNTTCKICFKTLACQSALEIHYRSHTKERPFKCLYCDRGFTTRGNMKQHLLTHKVRNGDKKSERGSTSPNAVVSTASSQNHVNSSYSPHSSHHSTSPPTSTFSPMHASHFGDAPHPEHNQMYQEEPGLPPRSGASQRSPMVSPQHPMRPSMSPQQPLYPPVCSRSSSPQPSFSTPEDTIPATSAGGKTFHSAEDFSRTEESERGELLNLKRSREGELLLPVSKRAQALDDVRPLDLHQTKLEPQAPGLPQAPASHHSPPSTLPVQVS